MSLILSGTDGLSDVDGTAATPAIRGTDTNTGIFFPAADTVAASVGGTEGLRLTTTGLGVGTTSPGEKLNVVGGGSTSSTVNFTGGSNNDNATIASDYSLIFQVDANNNVGGRDFNWRYGGKGYGDGTSLMVLNSSGILGLGVTPSAWQAAFASVMQLGGGGAIAADKGSVGRIRSIANAYFNGTNWIYINNGYANYCFQNSTDGSVSWQLAPSGTAGNAISFTQAMTLDASGNLGVGETSPGFRIDIKGSSFSSFLQAQNSTSTHKAIYGVDSSGGVDGAVAGSFSNHAFILRTNNTERARIDSSGNLLVGATSTISNATLLVSKSVENDRFVKFRNTASSSPFGQEISYTTTINNASNEFFMCSDNSAVRMSVRANGGIANFSGNNVNLSDRREKTNFAPAKSYLETICAIPVQTFNYIDQNMEEDPGLTLGVVAQDVQAVAPELVMESNWGTKEDPKMRLSIYQTDLQYALMKCIQEQQAIIESLTARITALEAK